MYYAHSFSCRIAGSQLPLPESPATESGMTRTASFANKVTCKGEFMLIEVIQLFWSLNLGGRVFSSTFWLMIEVI